MTAPRLAAVQTDPSHDPTRPFDLYIYDANYEQIQDRRCATPAVAFAMLAAHWSDHGYCTFRIVHRHTAALVAEGSTHSFPPGSHAQRPDAA